MPYDAQLDARVEEIITAWGATRKGTQALTRPEVRPFDISKNPMSGWVMVSPDVLDDNTLNEWLERARDFVSTLPPK
jgi:hypothetical protein